MLDNILNEGDLVFDIGANIGKLTLQFLEFGCTVLVVEPQDNLDVWYDKDHPMILDVLHIGLSDKAGVGTLNICSAANTLSTLEDEWMKTRFNEFTWDVQKEIELCTLDNLIKEYGKPDYIKIDVEGHERNVIKGLSQPVSCLSFEYVSEELEKAFECLDLLNYLGFDKFKIVNAIRSQEWHTIEESKGLLSKAHKMEFGDIYARYNKTTQ